MRLLNACFAVLALISSAAAAGYDVDGALEEGDQQNENLGYIDSYDFTADAGNEIRFAITGMDKVPQAVIIKASGEAVYTTFGVTGELTVNWKAAESGGYRFLATQRYKSPTAYHLRISDLPSGTVLD